MSEPGLIVTIDGPAGTGKSTVGRELAGRLGLEFLDTGAMYRAATALVLDQGVEPADERAVARIVEDAGIRFDWSVSPPTLIAQGAPMTDRLREADVAGLVSTIAAQAPVRAVLVQRQREIGRLHPRLISEGRDQGSVVFPDAAVKIYLHASPGVRAQRRARQIAQAGRPAELDQIERELIRRDELDSTRPVAPLVRAPGAIDADTSDLTFGEALDLLERIVREHAPAGSLAGAGASGGRDG